MIIRCCSYLGSFSDFTNLLGDANVLEIISIVDSWSISHSGSPMNQIYYLYLSGVFWSRGKVVSAVHHGMNTCALCTTTNGPCSSIVQSPGTFRTTVTSIRNSLTGPCDCTVWWHIYVVTAPNSHRTNLAPPTSHPLSLSRMVNYHDHIVIAQDYCTYTFGGEARVCGDNWLLSTAELSKLFHAVAGVYLCATGTRAFCSRGLTVTNNHNSALHFQLGVCHYSRLRVECLPKAETYLEIVSKPFRLIFEEGSTSFCPSRVLHFYPLPLLLFWSCSECASHSLIQLSSNIRHPRAPPALLFGRWRRMS